MERMALRARRSAGLYTGGVDEGLGGVLADWGFGGDEEQPRSQDDSVAQGQVRCPCLLLSLRFQRRCNGNACVSPGLGSVVCFYLFE